MTTNEFRISAKYSLGVPIYDGERKCPLSKTRVLDIYGDQAIACHGRGDANARNDLIPESQSCLGDIFVPTWKAGKPAAIDVTFTSSLQSNCLTNAATKAGYALDATDEKKYCLHDDNCAKMLITFFHLQLKVPLKEEFRISKKKLSGFFQTFLRTMN